MRRRAAGCAAAIVLAACQVNVDGAPCSVPGATADCPAGQSCGNDLRCSERALSCARSRCTPGVAVCDGPTGKEIVLGCTGADPVCGLRVEEDCAGRGMACGVRSGAPACECPAYAETTIVADPAGSPARGALPYPTGAAAPPQCRFGRLGDALQAAAERAPARALVLVEGGAGGSAVFGDATDEVWPLQVASNVALAGAAPPAGRTVVRGDPGASPLVSLAGSLERIRLERPATPGGGARGAGVEISCPAAPPPSLRDVEVDGGLVLDPEGTGTAGLGAGVKVTGDCGATLQDVDVFGAAGPALALEPTNAATVTVLGGSFSGSLLGVSIEGSSNVTLAPDPETAASVVVAKNAGEGVFFAPTSKPSADLWRVQVTRNAGSGVVIDAIDLSSQITIRECDIAENGLAKPRWYGSIGNQRQVGGVLIQQLSLDAFVFEGNRIFANQYDQIAFVSDSSGWLMGPASCGEKTNVFRCVSDTFYAVELRGLGSVDTRNNVWPGFPVSAWVGVGLVPPTTYCNPQDPGVPQVPACP